MYCKLSESTDIQINEFLEIVKDDDVVDSETGINIIQESDICLSCDYKEKCINSMKMSGKIYEKEEIIKLTMFEAKLEEMFHTNEKYSIAYKDGNLIITENETGEMQITVWTDVILSNEKMGVRVINSLIKEYGFLVKVDS